MSAHSGNTDQVKKIKLESSIQQVYWTRRVASPGGVIGLEVFTHYVGNASDLEITLKEMSGKTFGSYKDKISGNHFWAEIRVPADAKESLIATVKLPKHGLEMKSPALLLTPPIHITNVKWDKTEARRGDILKLSADIKGVPDGTEAQIEIYEHDSDGAHDFVTKFPVTVKNKKVEAEWEFEYHEDTDDIPTHEETERGYQAPEYFFRVKIVGQSADSGLVGFRDWVEIGFQRTDGQSVESAEFVLHFADSSTKQGRFDPNDGTRFDGVPPGPITISFEKLHLATYVRSGDSCDSGNIASTHGFSEMQSQALKEGSLVVSNEEPLGRFILSVEQERVLGAIIGNPFGSRSSGVVADLVLERLRHHWDQSWSTGRKDQTLLFERAMALPKMAMRDKVRRIFNNHRGRFVRALYGDKGLQRLLRDAGIYQERDRMPYLKYQEEDKNESQVRLNVDHIDRLCDNPSKALDSGNLRLITARENSAVLETLRCKDPFWREANENVRSAIEERLAERQSMEGDEWDKYITELESLGLEY